MCDQDYDFVPEFRSTNIPRQKSPATPELTVSTKMGPGVSSISSFPPLGQVTQLQSDTISFLVSIEVNEVNSKDAWEASVWHSTADAEWRETPLVRTLSASSPSPLQHTSPSRSILYFHAELHASPILNFTLKFRNGPDHPWRWVRDENGMEDGLVLVTPEKFQGLLNANLSDVIVDLNPDLRVKSVMSQVPNTELWTIEAGIGPAQNEKSAFSQIELGTPWGKYLR